MNSFDNKQSKYYAKYESQLSASLDENERLKAKNEELTYRIQDLEDEIE